jgi:hypothetical protein
VNGRTRAEVGGVGAVIAFFSSPELRSTAQLSVAHDVETSDRSSSRRG